MGYYNNTEGPFTKIAIALFGLIILVAVTDSITKWIQDIVKAIPKLPDSIEPYLVRVILMGIATVVCWQGHFGIFTSVGFEWRYNWENYLATGALASGGSSLLSKAFRLGNLMPSMVTGMASMLGFGGYQTTNTTIDQEELNQSD